MILVKSFIFYKRTFLLILLITLNQGTQISATLQTKGVPVLGSKDDNSTDSSLDKIIDIANLLKNTDYDLENDRDLVEGIGKLLELAESKRENSEKLKSSEKYNETWKYDTIVLNFINQLFSIHSNKLIESLKSNGGSQNEQELMSAVTEHLKNITNYLKNAINQDTKITDSVEKIAYEKKRNKANRSNSKIDPIDERPAPEKSADIIKLINEAEKIDQKYMSIKNKTLSIAKLKMESLSIKNKSVNKQEGKSGSIKTVKNQKPLSKMAKNNDSSVDKILNDKRTKLAAMIMTAIGTLMNLSKSMIISGGGQSQKKEESNKINFALDDSLYRILNNGLFGTKWAMQQFKEEWSENASTKKSITPEIEPFIRSKRSPNEKSGNNRSESSKSGENRNQLEGQSASIRNLRTRSNNQIVGQVIRKLLENASGVSGLIGIVGCTITTGLLPTVSGSSSNSRLLDEMAKSFGRKLLEEFINISSSTTNSQQMFPPVRSSSMPPQQVDELIRFTIVDQTGRTHWKVLAISSVVINILFLLGCLAFCLCRRRSSTTTYYYPQSWQWPL